MKKYYVIKNGLRYNGKEYQRGDVLDHKLGIRDQRILNNMVKMRKISVKPVAVTPVDPLPVPPPAPEPTSGVEIRHNGGGYYSIWENGICLSEGETIKGEKAAKKWLTDNL